MGAYIGAGLAVIPFFGFLVDTYDFPKLLLDAVFVAYVSMIPSVFLLAYNHGAPGKDPWGKAERVGIPVNLLLTVLLLAYVFLAPKTAEATTETVVITDEQGNVTEHLVPKAKYRRKLGLFFWTNESGDEALDWLRYGFPMMLERDLEQNRFFAATTPFYDAVMTRLQRAGYERGLGVPVAFQQEIADDFSWPTFVDGRFSAVDGGLSASIALYETETAERFAEHTVEGEDPAALVDELTDWLKRQLEIEDAEGLGRDLPVAEQLSASREALEKWVGGNLAEEFGGDLGTSLGALQEAVALDQSFARAHYELARVNFMLGKSDEAKAAMRDVKKHRYRLTERDQFFSKAFEAQIDRDQELAIKSLETVVKLYPDDVAAVSLLALLYSGNNEISEAIAAYQRIFDFDPAEDWALKEIGDLHIAERDYERALEFYQRYAERHGDDADIQFSIAQLHQAQGDLEAARATVEQASVLAKDPIQPALLLTQIDLAAGEVESAAARLREAEAEAEVAPDIARVLGQRFQLLLTTGRVGEALELWPRLKELQLQVAPPITILIQEGFIVPSMHGLIGQREAAESWIEGHVAKLSPPYDRFGDLYYLQLYTVIDDADGIEAHIDKAGETLAGFMSRSDALVTTLEISRGRALELRGDPVGAAAAFLKAMTSLDSSTLNLLSNELRVQCLVSHARASIDAGDLDAAADSLGQALTTVPAYPSANVEMARLERARGDVAAARERIDVALAVWADADAEFGKAAEARELAQELEG